MALVIEACRTGFHRPVEREEGGGQPAKATMWLA